MRENPLGEYIVNQLREGWDQGKDDAKANVTRIADTIKTAYISVEQLLLNFNAAGILDDRSTADIFNVLMDFGKQFVSYFDVDFTQIYSEMSALGKQGEIVLEQYPPHVLPREEAMNQKLLFGGWQSISHDAMRSGLLKEIWEEHRIEEAIEILSIAQDLLFPQLVKAAEQTLYHTEKDATFLPSTRIKRILNASFIIGCLDSRDRGLQLTTGALALARSHSTGIGEDEIPKNLLARALNRQALFLLGSGIDKESEQLQQLIQEIRSIESDYSSLELIEQMKSRIHELMLAQHISSLMGQHRYEEAEPYLLEMLEMSRSMHGDNHNQTSVIFQTISLNFEQQKKWTEAESYALEVIELTRRAENHLAEFFSINHLAELLIKQNKFKEAQLLLVERFESVGGNDPQIPMTFTKRIATDNLIELYEAWEKPEEAKKYRNMIPEDDSAEDRVSD